MSLKAYGEKRVGHGHNIPKITTNVKKINNFFFINIKKESEFKKRIMKRERNIDLTSLK